MSDPWHITEHQSVPGSRFDDLNMNLVREHIDTAIKRRSYDGPAQPEDYLLEHSCVVRDEEGQLIPALAGIILFAREPHHWVSVCGIDVVQFSSPSPNATEFVLSRQIRGDTSSIIDKTVDLLWARTEHRTRIVGTERVEEHAYPLAVLRELTVNAVVHRED